MASRASGARFRQRKLSTKHGLSILREDELLDSYQDEEDPSRQIPRIETGVERAEETEHHLQAVISASAAASLGGKVSQIYIPTPEVKSSQLDYNELYPKRFSEPSTYIRFSSTVEDCIGPEYCVTADDEKFIATLNESKGSKNGRITLDLFEEVMSFFEATASARQPFATIDNAPVLSFDELQSSYDDTISSEAQQWASEVYPRWETLRSEEANRPLMPALKFETGAETDDSDAYVCFRRREVRQARKTRGRDAQVVEKLKKLRRELEDARQLVHSINSREKLFLEKFENDRKVFDQRQELKRVKIQHGIKGDKGEDEELLINQRPVVKSKPKPEAPATQSRPSAARVSIAGASRPEARAPEQDLVQLDELKEEADVLVRRAVEAKINKHREWNRGFVDDTWKPICPPNEERMRSAHLPVVREVQLPTPPASVEGGDSSDKMDVDPQKEAKEPKDFPTPPSDTVAPREAQTIHRFGTPPPSTKKSLPTFRRRYGRLGRLHIDPCRSRLVIPAEQSGVVYESDYSDLEAEGDSDEDVIAYPVDHWTSPIVHVPIRPMIHGVSDYILVAIPVDHWMNWNMNYRASLMVPAARKVENQRGERRSSSANVGGDVVMSDAPPPVPSSAVKGGAQ